MPNLSKALQTSPFLVLAFTEVPIVGKEKSYFFPKAVPLCLFHTIFGVTVYSPGTVCVTDFFSFLNLALKPIPCKNAFACFFVYLVVSFFLLC